MYLKSVSGEILYESASNILKDVLREAIDNNIDLRSVDLRRANLTNLRLEQAQLQGACFWGASLEGAELLGCALNKADFRLACLNNASVANSYINKSDFRGTRVQDLNVIGADLSHCFFSDPAFFHLDLYAAKSLNQTVFTQNGEEDYLVETVLYQQIQAK